MLTKNLERFVGIALKGESEVAMNIFDEAIGIWKNDRKFR